jgi:exodeoxyribonuclease-3
VADRKKKLKLVTWNINSVRLRIDLVARLAKEMKPDVLCLQETKVQDGEFPHEGIERIGFPHRLIRGTKGYNGVAILSKIPLEPLETRDWCGRSDGRHLAARLPFGSGKLTIHNFYVPAGGDVPDPKTNEKFAHKLAFLDEMAAWSKSGINRQEPAVLVGDLNVAPLENDVWSHTALLKVVSHTPVEIARLTRIMEARPWVDAVRHFVPPSERLYTWWSYRARDWAASDRGRRLDHIWITPHLAGHLRGFDVLRTARDWPQPSDHVPVAVTLSPES